jgi:hypothetical protein
VAERFFRSYVFPEDSDVVFVGLGNWIRRDGDPTPLLGPYLCDAAEVTKRFDALEDDLKRCRRDAMAAVEKLKTKSALRRR